MLRGAISLAALGIISLLTLAPAHAQDSANKDQNSNPPPAASATSPSTAGDTSAATDKKDPNAPVPAPKTKKVWTNDDMGNLDHHGDVSVVGKRQPPQNNYNGHYSPPPGQSEMMVKYYRQQIEALEQQRDNIDKQISNLQDAKNGKTVDSSRTYNPWGGVQGDWNAQIAQLEKNKDNIQKQIDSAEEQIRKINP
jgi:uncharacterized protein YukE